MGFAENPLAALFYPGCGRLGFDLGSFKKDERVFRDFDCEVGFGLALQFLKLGDKKLFGTYIGAVGYIPAFLVFIPRRNTLTFSVGV